MNLLNVLLIISLILILILIIGLLYNTTDASTSASPCFTNNAFCNRYEINSNKDNEIFLSILFVNRYDNYKINNLICSDGNLTTSDFSEDRVISLSKDEPRQITIKCKINDISNLNSTITLHALLKHTIGNSTSIGDQIFVGKIIKNT